MDSTVRKYRAFTSPVLAAVVAKVVFTWLFPFAIVIEVFRNKANSFKVEELVKDVTDSGVISVLNNSVLNKISSLISDLSSLISDLSEELCGSSVELSKSISNVIETILVLLDHIGNVTGDV